MYLIDFFFFFCNQGVVVGLFCVSLLQETADTSGVEAFWRRQLLLASLSSQ